MCGAEKEYDDLKERMGVLEVRVARLESELATVEDKETIITPYGETQPSGIQDEIYRLAKQLKEIIADMSPPAHAVPGDTGTRIHCQFHHIESLVALIHQNADELKGLARNLKGNKEKIREMTAEEIYNQLNELEKRGLVKKLRNFISEAPSEYKEDTQKVINFLDALESVKENILKSVKEFGARLQDPIVWEYPKFYGIMNPTRLKNGNTLMTECYAGRVREITPDGKIAWEYKEAGYPTDYDVLHNGNMLICDNKSQSVIEVTHDKEIVWKYDQGLKIPHSVRRLENGNTLIADREERCVLEVTQSKEIAWEYRDKQMSSLYSIQRLKNGNTIVVDIVGSRIIEVTPDGEIAWEYTGCKWPSYTERLKNGNTLICDNGNFRIIEVAADKEIAWEYNEVKGVWRCQKQESGNILIPDTAGNRVIEVTPDKEIVWKYGAIDGPIRAERLQNGNILIVISRENRIIEVEPRYEK